MKPIDELSDEELTAELTRLQAIPIPSPASPKRPRRMDEAKEKKRKSLLDLIEES